MLRQVILIVFASTSILHAQGTDRFGVKIIVTRSNVEYLNRQPLLDYVDGPLYSPGIAVFYTPLQLDFLRIESELSFLRKGTSRNRSYTVPYMTGSVSGDARTTFDFTYLQLELNAQPIVRLGSVQMYAITGLNTSYLLNVYYLFVEQGKRKHILFGYSLGLGIDFSTVIRTPLFFEIKYNRDFGIAYEFGDQQLRHEVLMFSVGTSI